MKRMVMVVCGVLLGASAVMAQQEIAVQQDNLMRAQAKSMYTVIGKMVKGDIPYDQKAVDTALSDLETNVAKIATVFATNPKEDVKDAHYTSSPKIWQNKADFDSKIPPVTKAIADFKGKVKNLDQLKVAYTAINDRCGGCHDTYRVKLK
ncbi:cytochrome c [Bradyrhizobium sp. Arg237L]|uniref:c-type cytochrome n=1 Tax=Bradyrhizobium sp. Arg237L TaxID=3003352 RepID=UPI00249F3E24|nr:cytochrome c [Bradyrhizobium sp. Arg237L]MDI4233079.1 cytochrome c [Bradyrhizobium sp. Arg237L]